MKSKKIIWSLVIGICLVIVSWSLVIFIGGCAEAPKGHKVGDLTLAVSINPSPPKAGDNTLKIRLTDAAKKVIKDAQVKVTYSMPAMGNMSAMSSSIDAKLKKDSYEAIMSLSMLGTWNLEVNIVRPGSDSLTGKFKVTTGQKGIMFVPGRSRNKKMDMQMNMEKPQGPVVELTEEQERLAGVKTEAVRSLPLFKEIRTVGVVAYDPTLVVAQEEFIAALEAEDSRLTELAKRKLRIQGLSLAQIDELRQSRKVDSNLLLPEKKMWVYADIYEYELAWVRVGQRVRVESVAYPGRTFLGAVKAVEPILEAKTRSNRIRILVANPGLRLKPQMYVDVYLKSNSKYTLAIPKEAVLDTGRRKLAYVDRGNGLYEAREVLTGSPAQALIKNVKRKFLPVIKGVVKGEKVVIAANFLIDSQSQLSGGSSALYGGATEIN